MTSRGSGAAQTTSAPTSGSTMSTLVSISAPPRRRRRGRRPSAAITSAYERRRPLCSRAVPPATSVTPAPISPSEPCTIGSSTSVAEPVRDHLRRPREQRVVELVEVELVLEHRAQRAVGDDLAAGVERAPGDDDADARPIVTATTLVAVLLPRRSASRAARRRCRSSRGTAPRRRGSRRRPPIAASTVSTPTGISIEQRPLAVPVRPVPVRPPSHARCAAGVREHEVRRRPVEDEVVQAERVRARQQRADEAERRRACSRARHRPRGRRR